MKVRQQRLIGRWGGRDGGRKVQDLGSVWDALIGRCGRRQFSGFKVEAEAPRKPKPR